jgi:hypothetical protein
MSAADPDANPRLKAIIARHTNDIAFLVPGCPTDGNTSIDGVTLGELLADARDHLEAIDADNASILNAALIYLADALDADNDTAQDVLLSYVDHYLTGSEDSDGFMDGVEDMARKLAAEYGLSYPDGAVLHDQAAGAR